jgi:hypothetical protein
MTPDACSVYVWTYDTLKHDRVKEVSRHIKV